LNAGWIRKKETGEARGFAFGRITVAPVWAVTVVNAVVRVFNRHQAGLMAFFTTAMTSDVVAPTTGTYRLVAHFRMANEGRTNTTS